MTCLSWWYPSYWSELKSILVSTKFTDLTDITRETKGDEEDEDGAGDWIENEEFPNKLRAKFLPWKFVEIAVLPMQNRIMQARLPLSAQNACYISGTWRFFDSQHCWRVSLKPLTCFYLFGINMSREPVPKQKHASACLTYRQSKKTFAIAISTTKFLRLACVTQVIILEHMSSTAFWSWQNRTLASKLNDFSLQNC